MTDDEIRDSFEFFSKAFAETGLSAAPPFGNDFDVLRHILPVYEGDFGFAPREGGDPHGDE